MTINNLWKPQDFEELDGQVIIKSVTHTDVWSSWDFVMTRHNKGHPGRGQTVTKNTSLKKGEPV